MKKHLLLLLAVLPLIVSTAHAQTISSLNNAGSNTACQRTRLTLDYTVSSQFAAGNMFIIEHSTDNTTWTPAAEISATGAGSITFGMPTSIAPGNSFWVRLRATSNGAVSSKLVMVNSDGPPSTFVTVSPLTAQVCGGASLNFTSTTATGATAYTWYTPANTTITSGAGTTSISLASTTSASSGYVHVRPTNACGQMNNHIDKVLVNAPASLKTQFPNGITTGNPINWGSDNLTTVTGDVVYIQDGAGAYTGCNSYAAGSLTGKIALIDRGSCSFSQKAYNAQRAGAIGVILANNVAGVINLTEGNYGQEVTIPVVIIDQTEAGQVKSAISSGTVNITLRPHGAYVSYGAATASSLTQTACNRYTLNGSTYTTSGTYSQTVTNASGCDSVITLNLTINNVDTTVTVSGNTITSDEAGASYQWIDCATGTAISGATGQSYTGVASGNYKVMITKNGCTLASACINPATFAEISSVSANVSSACPRSRVILSYTASGAFLAGNVFTVEHSTDNVTWTSAASITTTSSGSINFGLPAEPAGTVLYTRISSTSPVRTSAATMITISGALPGDFVTISPASAALCNGKAFNFTSSTSPNATGYDWFNPANTTINSGDGTTGISLTPNTAFSNGELYVVATSACGSMNRNIERAIINNPSSLNSLYPSGMLTGSPVNWGSNNTSSITGDIVYIQDGSGSYLGCSPFAPGSLNGKIALIDRGSCSFSLKAYHAQMAGAVGVIFANNAAGIFQMTGSFYAQEVTIPAAIVDITEASEIKNALLTGAVNITLKPYGVMMTGLNPTTSSVTETACNSYTLNGFTFTSSGIYTQTITNSQGCDSIITLNLTITNVPTSVTVSGNTLTADASGAVYQWLDCDNANMPIAGETNQSFTGVSTGNYAVEITMNGCTVTTPCINPPTYADINSVSLNAVSVCPRQRVTLTYSVSGAFTAGNKFIVEYSTDNATWTAGAEASATTSGTINFGVPVITTPVSTIYVRLVSTAPARISGTTLTLSLSGSLPGDFVTITGAPSFCNGTQVSYTSGTSQNATTYNWSSPVNTVINSGNGTGSITLTANSSFNTGELYVIPSNSCGSMNRNISKAMVNGSTSLSAMYPSGINTGSAVNWGSNNASSLTADVIYIQDGSGSYLGCSPYAGGSLTGKIALIDRGTCSFSLKAYHAQLAGAAGVLFANNVAGIINLSGGEFAQEVTIPVAIVDQTDANNIKNALLSGTVSIILKPYSVTITGNPNTLDNTTSVSGLTITANQAGATYQWINCGNNNSVVAGETSQSYTPPFAGNYAVIISANGCSVTSDCVLLVGEKEVEMQNIITLYPNPSNGEFNISTRLPLTNGVVRITDLQGKSVMEVRDLSGTAFTIDLSGFSSGMYFVEVSEAQGKVYRSKLMKN